MTTPLDLKQVLLNLKKDISLITTYKASTAESVRPIAVALEELKNSLTQHAA